MAWTARHSLLPVVNMLELMSNDRVLLSDIFMSPLRRHIFVCFLAKWGFFGPSSVKRGRTHMSGASTSTYPENLASGGQLHAELRGRVSLFFLFVCLYVCLFVRHAKMLGTESLDGSYMHCTWGERA